MTTRAGAAGLITGLVITIMIYPLYATWLVANKSGQIAIVSFSIWIGVLAAVLLFLGGGIWAARWSGSINPGRCAALGGLAGGLAGTIVYCLWGAAAAGMLFGPYIYEGILPQTRIETISLIIWQTMVMYLLLFLGGSVIGMLGGWLVTFRAPRKIETFDKEEPQMALNASITAVPASIIATTMAAIIFPRLAMTLYGQPGKPFLEAKILDLPVLVSLLLVLVSHLALTLVVPHEARQAEHRCGLDEVKMGAFVGIGAAPLLTLLLFFTQPDLYSNPFVMIALLIVSSMSLFSVLTLVKLVLPRRASFPEPQEEWQKREASLFGTIARSHGLRLVVLCIGCGILMVLPLYISVVSVLINLSQVMDLFIFPLIPDGSWKLFTIQAMVSTGMMIASSALLITIYLFYLNLGRWYCKWNAHRASSQLDHD